MVNMLGVGVGLREAYGVEAEGMRGLEGVGLWIDGSCATGMAAAAERRVEKAPKREVKRILVDSVFIIEMQM